MQTKHILTLIACAILATPAALAQGTVSWHGQDNEFGSIRVPYAVDMDGERVPVEAKVVLRKNYEDKDSRFFMFAFDVRNTPLDVTFDHLIRTDTGAEMPCYQRQGDSKSQLKCFVDLKDMPEPGTEIIMRGTVGSGKMGNFQVGAIVLPFTYTWEKVEQSNGLPAELYGGTQVNVHGTAGGSGGQAKFGGDGNFVPGLGTIGLLAGVGVAALGMGAMRRRRE